MPDFTTGEKLTAANLDAHVDWNKGLVDNFGFTVTINSPDDGDITLAFFQGDASSNADAANPIKVNFSGRQAALKKAAAQTLKLDSTDDFDLDTRVSNTEVFLFIYAIDRNGTLEFGVGPRPDFTRASGDFTTVEGEAVDRDHVFCTAAITANDICRVIGFFKATYNTTNNDWDSVTANSAVVGPPPGPHPDMVAKAWINFDGTGTIAINSSRNVSSIADTGTGSYDVLWDSNFASGGSYACVSGHGSGTTNILTIHSLTGGQISINVFDPHAAAAADQQPLFIAAFGV